MRNALETVSGGLGYINREGNWNMKWKLPFDRIKNKVFGQILP